MINKSELNLHANQIYCSNFMQINYHLIHVTRAELFGINKKGPKLKGFPGAAFYLMKYK